MDFIQAFTKIKNSIVKTSVDSEDVAIQVEFTDADCSGIMYIQVSNGTVFVEPYNYFDNNCVVKGSYKDFVRIFTGRLKFETALYKELICVTGNLEAAKTLQLLATKRTTRK